MGTESFEAIRKAEQVAERLTAGALRTTGFPQIIDLAIALISYARQVYDEGRETKYMTAVTALGSRLVNGGLAGYKLAEIGRYYESFLLARVAISAVNTLKFISLDSTKLDEWFRWEELSRLDDDAPGRQRLYRMFRESSVRDALKRNGIETHHQIFRDLSEMVHATLYGIRFERIDSAPDVSEFTRKPRADFGQASLCVTLNIFPLINCAEFLLEEYERRLGKHETLDRLAAQFKREAGTTALMLSAFLESAGERPSVTDPSD